MGVTRRAQVQTKANDAPLSPSRVPSGPSSPSFWAEPSSPSALRLQELPTPHPSQGTGRPSFMMHWDKTPGQAPRECPPTQPGLRLAESPWEESRARLGPGAPPAATRLSNPLHLNFNRYPQCTCPEEPPSPWSCSPSTLPALAPSDQLPSPRTTQPSNPKVKKPPLILTLPLSQAICHLHGSPSLCSNLPTAGQLLCLGERNSPPLAWHSHFPHALPRGCEANLFLFSALSKASP